MVFAMPSRTFQLLQIPPQIPKPHPTPNNNPHLPISTSSSPNKTHHINVRPNELSDAAPFPLIIEPNRACHFPKRPSGDAIDQSRPLAPLIPPWDLGMPESPVEAMRVSKHCTEAELNREDMLQARIRERFDYEWEGGGFV